MPQSNRIALKQEWATAWQSPRFRRRIIIAAIFAVAIASCFPIFFQTIEKREGVVLNDWLLNKLPAHDVSLPLMLIVWSMTALLLFRCIQDPDMLLTYLWSYIVLSLVRFVTISLVPLNAPLNLIGLVDPLSNAFYGAKFVTKDLFFSGHTSTICLMALCLRNRTERIFGFVSTAAVGALLLVQHVHYTVDVITAPVFAWIIWRLTKRILADRTSDTGEKLRSRNY